MFFHTLTRREMDDQASALLAVDPTWPLEKLLADRPRKWEMSFVGCDSNGTPVAYCILHWHDRFNSIHNANLAVHPGYRGRGEGSAVIREALQRGMQTTKVAPENTAAVRLYERHGFVHTRDDNRYWFMDRRPQGRIVDEEAHLCLNT